MLRRAPRLDPAGGGIDHDHGVLPRRVDAAVAGHQGPRIRPVDGRPVVVQAEGNLPQREAVERVPCGEILSEAALGAGADVLALIEPDGEATPTRDDPGPRGRETGKVDGQAAQPAEADRQFKDRIGGDEVPVSPMAGMGPLVHLLRAGLDSSLPLAFFEDAEHAARSGDAQYLIHRDAVFSQGRQVFHDREIREVAEIRQRPPVHPLDHGTAIHGAGLNPALRAPQRLFVQREAMHEKAAVHSQGRGEPRRVGSPGPQMEAEAHLHAGDLKDLLRHRRIVRPRCGRRNKTGRDQES